MIIFILFILGILFIFFGLLFFVKAADWKFCELDEINERIMNGTLFQTKDKTKNFIKKLEYKQNNDKSK